MVEPAQSSSEYINASASVVSSQNKGITQPSAGIHSLLSAAVNTIININQIAAITKKILLNPFPTSTFDFFAIYLNII